MFTEQIAAIEYKHINEVTFLKNANATGVAFLNKTHAAEIAHLKEVCAEAHRLKDRLHSEEVA